jgi:hypothetical protein
MKKLTSIFLLLFLLSCSSKKVTSKSTDLYQILIANDFGGATFKFYEIISQEDEFKILLSDDILKKYVKKDDIQNANFVLLNLGEKPTEGYAVKIVKVEELLDKIIVTLKEIEPNSGTMTASVITRPYAVLKINSKKPIEIK